jgi:hypothetical protein
METACFLGAGDRKKIAVGAGKTPARRWRRNSTGQSGKSRQLTFAALQRI